MYNASTSANTIAYTANFGNGLTGTVGIVDTTSSDNVAQGNLRNTDVYDAVKDARVTQYGGNRMPDVVANLNVTQAWGSAQISAALHDDYSLANGSKIGYAVQAGVEFKLDQIAKGDRIALQAGYTSGALGYITQMNTGSGNIGAAFIGGSKSTNYIGQDWALDTSGGMHLTNAWGLLAGFHHEFNKNVHLNFEASYLAVDGYQTRDLQTYGLQSDIRWLPTGDSKFYIALALEYGAINYNSTTKAFANATSNVITNASGWETAIRVNRSF